MPGETGTILICDDCGAKVPVEDLVRPWCGECGWNVSATALPLTSRLDKYVAKLGRIHGPRLLAQVSAAEDSRIKPIIAAPIVIAFGISALVFAGSFAIAAFGFYLLVFEWQHPALVVGGILCLATAWVLRPRFGAAPSECLSRENHRALFELVDAVADKLGIAPIERVTASEDFNASMSEPGLRRLPVLMIGLPLWMILGPQERVALIAHELAHRANGDPLRGWIIGSALGTLDRWRYLLEPVTLGQVDLAATIAHFLLRLLGAIVAGVQRLLLGLLYMDGQRAEYLADLLAARISGGEACLSLLHKMRLGENLRAVVERVYFRGDTDGRSVIEAFAAFVRAVPEREMERIRRADEKEEACIDASHPPTAYRTRFIVSRNLDRPELRLSEEDSMRIDEELRPLFARYSMMIMDQAMPQR